MKRLKIALLMLALLGAVAQGADSDEELVRRLTTNMMCTCGCPHQIIHCGDECGLAPQLQADIRARLAGGASEQDVYLAYEAEYGPSIYAAPKAEGFNLLAWILPFVALGFGGLFVWGAVRKLRSDGASDSEQEEPAATPPMEDRYRKMLQKEMAE